VLLYIIGYLTNAIVLETHQLSYNNTLYTNQRDLQKANTKKEIKQIDNDTVIVDSNNSGDFISIQQAINATRSYPDKRITILIKNGIYFEKVKIHAWNTKINLIGESKEKTIITYNDHFKKINLGRNSTFHTYTLLVEGNDCILKNLTIENTSGEVGQAVALNVNAHRVVIANCNLLGHQDTLYTSGENCKNYFKDCYIEGTTDFIFGDATAFFENCKIHSKSNSYITAASTPENHPFGYVFKNCVLTANENVTKVFLGRPWRNYAKTVFIHCLMNAHIIPEGWHNWSKQEAEKTVFYAEYQCTGKGYNPEKRVKWSHQLTKKQSKLYSINNILKDDIKNWYSS
jgi:pectinesterase